MAPQQTVSAYQRYKEDTTLFMTWLSNAAESCGWRPSKAARPASATPTSSVQPPAPAAAEAKSTRLKGKARKAAKEAKGSGNTAQDGAAVPPAQSSVRYYSLTTRQLLDQVELIAQAKTNGRNQLRMPGYIRKALQSSIDSRSRFCDWFDRLGNGTAESNETHRHFVQVLRQALEILPAEEDTCSPRPRAVKKDDAAIAQQDDTAFLRNAFEALKVEDPSDVDAPSLEDMAPSVATATGVREKRLYQIEMDKWAEMAFHIFSFFEDLHRLRQEMQNVWTRYQHGSLDIVQATILTTAALEIVRQAEQEAYRAYTSLYPPTKDTLEAFIGVIYTSESRNSNQAMVWKGLMTLTTEVGWTGVLPEETTETPEECIASEDLNLPTEFFKFSELDEFLFIPMGKVVDKLARLKAMIDRKTILWPMPIGSLKYWYIAQCPELLEDPRTQTYIDQDTFVTQLFHDMRFDDIARHHDEASIPPDSELGRQIAFQFPNSWDDALFSTIRQLWVDGSVTARVAWAAQVAYEIYQICGNRSWALQKMKETAANIQSSYQFDVTLDHSARKQMIEIQGLDPKEKHAAGLINLYRRVHLDLVDPALPHGKERFLERDEHLRLQLAVAKSRGDSTAVSATEPADLMVGLHPDSDFLLNANMLNVGTLLLDTTTMVEEMGVALANNQVFIFGVAHLYNALTVLGICSVRWPEMDRVIEMQANAIFANDIPSKPTDMFPRFTYRVGLTVPGGQAMTWNYRVKKRPWQFKPSPATQALRGFFAGEVDLPRVLSELRLQAEIHELSRANKSSTATGGTAATTSSTSAAARRGSKPRAHRAALPRETLAQLEKYLLEAVPDMNIDYAGLTRRCGAFIRTLLEKHEEYYSTSSYDQWLRENGLMDSFRPVMRILADLDNKAHEDRPKKRESEGGGSSEQTECDWFSDAPMLRIAKDMMEAMICERNDIGQSSLG